MLLMLCCSEEFTIKIVGDYRLQQNKKICILMTKSKSSHNNKKWNVVANKEE